MADSSKPPIKWTPQEMQCLDECGRESFWYRSLPMAVVLAAGAYFGVKQGYLKPNKRFGPYPKMALATIVGHFVGQFSYASTCIDKFMKLPNSPFADQLRKHQEERGRK